MKWRNYYEKLRRWEAEGYDVSDLRQKWFPRGVGSRTRVVLSLIAASLVVVGGILMWQHISNGSPDDEVVATLSTSIRPLGGGSVSPSIGTFDVGEEVILTASPASGYRFSHWDGDVNGIENPITIEVHRDANVTAHFAKVSYSLSLSASLPEGGSVTPASGTYEAGAVVDIVAEAEEGYRFTEWGGEVDAITNVNAASTTITMHGDYSIVANFVEELPGQYDLTTGSTEGGLVTQPGEGTFTYEEGERVTLTASPASGYRFSHWSGDGTGTSATTTVTMDRDRNVTATFVRQYTLSTSVSPFGGGSVVPSSGTYDAGTSVTLAASPASGYHFSHWTGDSTGTSVITTVTIDRDMHVVGNFGDVENDEPTITLSPPAGVPGTGVTVRGYCFAADQWVDIYYAGTRVAEVRTTIATTSFAATFVVPEGHSGNQQVRAEGTYDSATADFRVTAGVTVMPAEGTVGTEVTVKGLGFGRDEGGIQIYFHDQVVADGITATVQGSWEGTIAIPPVAGGTHSIRARGDSTDLTGTAFGVRPGISIDRSSGTTGQIMTMTGRAFAAYERHIRILFDGEELVTGIRADDKGHWQESFEVPELPAGTYTITAEGDRTRRVDISSLSFLIE